MAARTGSQYVNSLRDDRDVWVNGERVSDVTEHPAFQAEIATVADCYDWLQDPANAELLTMPSTRGDGRVSVAYLLPQSSEDLARRRKMVEFYARKTAGSMGRLPEYMPTFLLGLWNMKEHLGRDNPEHTRRIEAFWDFCRETDPYVMAAFADPQVDRSKPNRETGLLHVSEIRPDGIVLNGCKSVAQAGPVGNEFLVLTVPRGGASPEEVVYATIHIPSPGLTFICREARDTRPNTFDRPLGARFVEMEAWAMFENVLVPWERVFFSRSMEYNVARETPQVTVDTGMFSEILYWAWTHNLIRLAVKAELLAGVCMLISNYIRTAQFPHVQELIANTVCYAQMIHATVLAAEANPVISPVGLAVPNPLITAVGKIYAVENHGRILDILKELCGQGVLMIPSEADLASEVGPKLSRYFDGGDVPAEHRVRLFHLAWDLACDSYAGRQYLFEQFNAGNYYGTKIDLLRNLDKSSYLALAREFAGIDPQRDIAFAGR